ncbi:MAG: hypothetical protein RLZZ338_1934 [Cyanobacteriota bacterium]|jgi:hypothetical protein
MRGDRAFIIKMFRMGRAPVYPLTQRRKLAVGWRWRSPCAERLSLCKAQTSRALLDS